MRGSVDASLARNLDLVATIADLLGTRVFYPQDGRSVFSAEVRRRKLVAVRTRDFARLVRIGLPELSRRRAHWRREWARLFGTGAGSALLYGDPWDQAYRIGPHPELLGRRVATLPVESSGPITARVANAELLDDVAPGADYFPTRVTGPLEGVPADERVDLALAVNGRIRAVGRSFDLSRKEREFFSLVVPESTLRRGANRLELFALRRSGTLVRIYGTR
jgi:hypothetical protein